MKKMKRIGTAAIAAAIIGSTVTVSAFAAESQVCDDGIADECVEIITDHFNSINEDDWLSWANYYVPFVRESYVDFVSNPNCQENNVGILAVNSVDVISVCEVSNTYAPNYPELAEFYANNDYKCFIATMDITTNEETDYFQDGITQRLVVMAKENGQWGVGASCEYQAPVTRGVGYGFLDGNVNNPPSTITVDMHVGSDYSSIDVSGNPTKVDFKTFVQKTVLGEIGFLGYPAEAVKAITLSDKMFAWWCYLGSYRDTYGCDIIGNFDVAYSPLINVNDLRYGQTVNYINSVINKYVVSSSGKFFAIGANNYTNYDYSGSGVVVQSGAKRLANIGYDHEQILRYYLNDSSHNNGNVGKVQIGTSTV